MARVVRPDEARDLGLPGRHSLEIVSGETGASAVTLRRVEIPVAQPGATPRGKHSHSDCEECIYVLSGRGSFCTDAGELPLASGDTILIPPGEMHMTRNDGEEPLVLLCFFPVASLHGHG